MSPKSPHPRGHEVLEAKVNQRIEVSRVKEVHGRAYLLNCYTANTRSEGSTQSAKQSDDKNQNPILYSKSKIEP